MKIICTKENIRRALNHCSRIISSITTLPVLGNVLLKTSAGQLEISSTNLEIAVRAWVGGQIEQEGEITIPGKTLTEYVNSIPDEKITLETNENDLTISTSKTQSVLKGLSSEEFPLIPQVEAILKLKIPVKDLSESLNMVVYAASGSETQPELSGVLFFLSEKTLRLVATDRYRLAEKKIATPEFSGEEKKIIVPGRAVSELIKILSDASGSVEMRFSENQALFHTENVELTTRLIEAQYPDYQQIIPSDFNTQAIVSTKELGSALKLTGLFVAESSNVEMQLNSSEGIKLASQSQKAGSTTSRVDGEITGDSVKILFNHRYLLDCLNHIKREKITLRLISSTAPATIIPEGEKDYLYLVMPIKT